MPTVAPALFLSRSMSGFGRPRRTSLCRERKGTRSASMRTPRSSEPVTASFRRAHPRARIQAAFHEGTRLTLPRIGLDRPFRTSRLSPPN